MLDCCGIEDLLEVVDVDIFDLDMISGASKIA